MRNFLFVLTSPVLFSLAAVAQGQIQVPPPVPPPPLTPPPVAPPLINKPPTRTPPGGNTIPDTDGQTAPPPPAPEPTTTVTVAWLKTQSDSLWMVISCYLDKSSLDNLKKLEAEHKYSPARMIEVRIEALHNIARQNASSHCK